MNRGQALNAMDIGERVRFRGIPCVVVGVATRRKPVRDPHTGAWSCVGDMYFGVDLIDRNGGAMQGRLDELMTEEEYLVSIKKGENNEQNNS